MLSRSVALDLAHVDNEFNSFLDFTEYVRLHACVFVGA